MTWTRGPLIGHGSSAAVYLAKRHSSDHHHSKIQAVKSVEYNKSSLLQRECEIHSNIKSPHVIEYRGYDVTLEEGRLMYNVLMEYASGGTVSDSIYKSPSSRRMESRVVIRSYTRGILLGIGYLHRNGIVHCDIKPTNILVTESYGRGGDYHVKIADFGCARRVLLDDCNNQTTKMAGTPMYMAPEVVRGEQQSYAADIWSFGCTVLEMVTGRPPWTDVKDPVSALYMIGFSDRVPEIPEFLSEEAKDFLRKCLRRIPEERWSCDQLLMHPFVCGEKKSTTESSTISSSCLPPLPPSTPAVTSSKSVAPAPLSTSKRKPPDSETPTSILDNGMIWESSSSVHDVASTDHKISTLKDINLVNVLASILSAAERIQQLIREIPASSRFTPNWHNSDGEGWVTVRTNDSTEEREVDPAGFCGDNQAATMVGSCHCHNVNMGWFCQTIHELDRGFCNMEFENCCNVADDIDDGQFCNYYCCGLRKSGRFLAASCFCKNDLSCVDSDIMKIDHSYLPIL